MTRPSSYKTTSQFTQTFVKGELKERGGQGELSLVMEADFIRKAIRRIAHEIIEQNQDLSRLVIAGIPTRGKIIASRIAAHIAEIEGISPTLGIVDVSMHRDDLATRISLSALEPTELPMDLDGRPLVLIDDVLYTGRSCRAAMDAIASFGRPSRIQLAVLVDRGHRELPIRADFVGKNVPTAFNDRIRVRFEETDNVPDSVTLVHEMADHFPKPASSSPHA